MAEIRYLDPISKLNALDYRGEADFSGLIRDHDTAPAASLQALGIHPLQGLLNFEPKAINPTVSVVDAFKPTQVGTHFNWVG